MSFAKEVKETLKKIDITPFVEDKGNGNFKASYLSWAKAWDILTDKYPESSYTRPTVEWIGNSTAEVYCSVTVREGESELTREMWLPVMGNNLQSLADPNTRQISDAKMRCLVKCIAMFGLGIHLYQGEDVPLDIKSYTDEQLNTYRHFINTKNGFSLYAMCQTIGEQASNDLYNSAPKGQKVEFKNQIDGLIVQGVDQWNIFETDLITAVEKQDAHQIKNLIDNIEPTQMEKQYMANRFADNWKTILSLYKEAE